MIEHISPQEHDGTIRVLALCDYVCSTGFATVSRNILRELDETGNYTIDVVAINYDGLPYDHTEWRGTVYPAISLNNMHRGDVFGRQRFLDLLGSGNYDVAFIIQDSFNIVPIMPQIKETYDALPKKFKTILYYPIDSTPKAEWVTQCIGEIDYPVPYTNYAKAETLKIEPALADKLVEPIYHGNNQQDFYYVPDRKDIATFRTQFFSGETDGKFLITNVNRNQPRKDIIRNFMILKELRDRGHDNAVLYFHMRHDDAGGNILVMADHFGFELRKDFFLPSPKVFNENKGLDIDVVNYLYNASDMLLSTTLGEGWGLSITEAMATRTPIVAPNNTSLIEMLADNRGFLTKSGADPSMWVMKEGDNERLRPLMDITDAADNIERIMKGILPDIDGAADWVAQHNWHAICTRWIDLFEQAATKARIDTQKAVVAQKREHEPQLNRQQRRALKKGNKNASV